MNAASTRESETFLRALHGRHTDFIELRLKNDGGKWHSEFFPTGELERAAEQAEKLSSRHDVYFGVGARDGKGGARENMTNLPAVWVDVDLKNGVSRDTLQERVKGLPRPSMIVNSGGGWHLYWILKEAAGPEDFEQIRSINSALAAILGGDQGATDPARILRVPGTLNRKKEYGTPRPVELLEANGAEYNLSDFDLFAPASDSGNTPRAMKSSPDIQITVERCAFFQRWERDAATLPEPEWHAGQSILGRLSGGVDYIHTVSSRYPGYSRKETDAKILHALNDAGPRTCAAIKALWDCGRDCGVKSPAVLAVKEPMERTAEREPEIVVLEEMETESARNLLSTPSPPVDEVFAGLLARGEVLTLGGPPKSGKSYFALQAALCGAAGKPLLGCDVPRPFKVLYVIAEGSKRRLKDRLLNATPYIPGIEDEDFDRLHVIDTRGMLQIDTAAGEKTLLRLAEPFDLIVLDTLYALQGHGDENSHKDFRAVSGPLNRLKHSAGGKAVLLIHHVRKNSGEDAGADELRGAGFAGFSDAVVRLYKRRGRMGIHYELKFDLRNYAEREDQLLTRMGPLFAPMDATNSKIDLQNYVVATITERGGRVEGRESLIKILVALTKMKRQTCINAIGEAITSGRVSSAPMPGTNAKVYFLTDGNDDE